MTALQFVFLVVAAVTLGAALMVVSSRNLVHSALWLVVALFGVAVFFAMLNAGFLAVVQVVIYIGAIAILMIFAIMFTQRVADPSRTQMQKDWLWGALVGAGVFALLVWMFSTWREFSTQMPVLGGPTDPLRYLGMALVSPNAYILPFELASVLLLGALIGSLVIAWERKEPTR